MRGKWNQPAWCGDLAGAVQLDGAHGGRQRAVHGVRLLVEPEHVLVKVHEGQAAPDIRMPRPPLHRSFQRGPDRGVLLRREPPAFVLQPPEHVFIRRQLLIRFAGDTGSHGTDEHAEVVGHRRATRSVMSSCTVNRSELPRSRLYVSAHRFVPVRASIS